LDSHQLDVIVGELLVPFARGNSEVRTAAFDEPSDAPVDVVVDVDPVAVLVFDGLFLHRPELNGHWGVTFFLDADVRRDREWLRFLLDGLPDDDVERAATLDLRLARARWPRYGDGWRCYVDAAQPASEATVVIDNNDVRTPTNVHVG
jgi:uridine kinase